MKKTDFTELDQKGFKKINNHCMQEKKIANGRNLISKVTTLYDFKCPGFNN